MTLDVATFRILRPAFKDPERYPNGLIQHYLTFADKTLNVARWADLLDEGTLDFVSHYVAVLTKEAQAAERGAISGNASGRLTQKSVGGVSVSYDLGLTTERDGGWWNETTYGSKFLNAARMVGSGGAQLGIGYVPPYDGPGWNGPPQWNFLPSGPG